MLLSVRNVQILRQAELNVHRYDGLIVTGSAVENNKLTLERVFSVLKEEGMTNGWYSGCHGEPSKNAKRDMDLISHCPFPL
jgi:alcohol dehydrogenase class IV